MANRKLRRKLGKIKNKKKALCHNVWGEQEMSKKKKSREPKSDNILLADILARLRIFDKRLDKIEGEIVGVKNAVNIFMKVSKLVGAIAGIGTLIWKGVGFFIPKGRNGKNNSNRKSKKNKSKK